MRSTNWKMRSNLLNGVFWSTEMFQPKRNPCKQRAGDRDRTGDVQGRKSLSVMLDCPFGKVRVRRDTQGFGAGGSFWRNAAVPWRGCLPTPAPHGERLGEE